MSLFGDAYGATQVLESEIIYFLKLLVLLLFRLFLLLLMMLLLLLLFSTVQLSNLLLFQPHQEN